jgi:hypothetical protein
MTRALTVVCLVAGVYTAACDERPPEMPPGTDFVVRPALLGDSLRRHGAGALRFRGAVSLQSRNERIGGFSGLHVSDDGTQLVATGWGGWLRGTLEYDQLGNLAGFAFESESPFRDPSGRPIVDDDDVDAESLEYDGTSYYVGFETNNRIWRYSSVDARAEPVELPTAEVASIPGWGGFSSVVVPARGVLLALTEGWQDDAGNTKGFLRAGEGVESIALRAAPGWLPVDLALLPDGDLLLVEVRQGESGRYDTSRFSRIAGSAVEAGAVMRSAELAVLRPPDHLDKIEGVHATRGRDGETIVYAISDSRRGWPTNVLMFELVGH